MGKRYDSVPELVRDLTDDEVFLENLEEGISRKAVAKKLFSMRCADGVTQKEMAERLGCTQSKISKIENADSGSIKLGDLIAYAHALDLQLSIAFHEGRTAVECVKFHAFQIKKHLDYLAKLADRDDKILEGVSDFYAETLYNFLRLFEKSVSQLPMPEQTGKSVLEICAPAELGEAEFIDEEGELVRE